MKTAENSKRFGGETLRTVLIVAIFGMVAAITIQVWNEDDPGPPAPLGESALPPVGDESCTGTPPRLPYFFYLSETGILLPQTVGMGEAIDLTPGEVVRLDHQDFGAIRVDMPVAQGIDLYIGPDGVPNILWQGAWRRHSGTPAQGAGPFRVEVVEEERSCTLTPLTEVSVSYASPSALPGDSSIIVRTVPLPLRSAVRLYSDAIRTIRIEAGGGVLMTPSETVFGIPRDRIDVVFEDGRFESILLHPRPAVAGQGTVGGDN